MSRLRLCVLVAVIAGCGVAVYLGSVEQPIGFSSVLELWGDVLRDADQVGLKATRVSAADEMQLGRDMARRSGWRENFQQQPRVERVGRTLVPGVQRKNIQYEFHAVDIPVANAFSLPGGQVFVTVPLLSQLRNDDELAAILGHEMAHVDLRHCIERYQFRLKARKLHVAPAGELVDLARWLATAEYNKYQEYDADAAGVALSAKAGYDPAAAAALFRHLFAEPARRPPSTPVSEAAQAAISVPFDYWRSHPPSADRAARLEELARKARVKVPATAGQSRP